MQTELGLPVEVLTPREAQQHVPFHAEGVHACTYGPDDGVVDPKAITRGYLTLAERHGATVTFNAPATHIDRANGVWRVTAGSDVWEADVVVNAAGAASGLVASLAGLKLPVEPSHRSVFVTEPLPTSHAYPLTVDVATGTYLRSDGDRLLVGRSNAHEPPGFKATQGVNWGWLEDTMRPAAERFPFTAGLRVDRTRSWWGYYALSPDGNAVIGFHPDADGWLDATGFSGHGIQHAAGVGVAVAELVGSGVSTTLDITPYHHSRFSVGAASPERHVV
jgi:sarcosine oxidase subunit beta